MLLKTGFMFLRTKKGTKLVLVFHNKYQFLNRFHVFVRGCLVSVIENRLHGFKNKKKESNLFLFSHVLVFHNKNQFLNKFHVFVRECLVSAIENGKNKNKYLFILPHT